MTNEFNFNQLFISNFSALSIGQLDIKKRNLMNYITIKSLRIISNSKLSAAMILFVVLTVIHIIKHNKDQSGINAIFAKMSSVKLLKRILYCITVNAKNLNGLFFECLFNKETVKTTANKVGIYENTVLAWRHKTIYLIYKIIEHDKMTDLIHHDKNFFECIYKGKKNMKITGKRE